MYLVHQKCEDGCGIACVAMVTGVTYAKAKATLPDYWEPKGTTKPQMLKGLRACGIIAKKAEPIAGREYCEFKFDAVLFGYLDGDLHWCVWDCKRKKLLDPYRPRLTFRCTFFIRAKVKIESP